MNRRGFLAGVLALPAAPLLAALPKPALYGQSAIAEAMRDLLLLQAERIVNPPVIMMPTPDGMQFYSLQFIEERDGRHAVISRLSGGL
jgi:hypothetical protein